MLSLEVGQPIRPTERARKAVEENKAIRGAALKAFSALRFWAVRGVGLGVGCPAPTFSILPQMMSSSQHPPHAKNSPNNMLSYLGASPWAPAHSLPNSGKYLHPCRFMELLNSVKAELFSFRHKQRLPSLICLLTSCMAGSHFSHALC